VCHISSATSNVSSPSAAATSAAVGSTGATCAGADGGASGGSIVSHNDAIYLIDARGREREIVHADTPVALLTQDLRTLATERAE
jgi:cytochrome oxidase Cu insertion factor (SCO1/SenC/PrrC family)